MSEEEKAIEVLKTVIEARKFSGIYTSIDIIFEAIETILKLYEDKKKEIYAIAKTNYILGQTEERSQWYKKINEKIEELKKENDELEEKKTFRITDKELIAEAKNNEAVTDLLNYKIRLAIIGQLEELIGKEE